MMAVPITSGRQDGTCHQRQQRPAAGRWSWGSPATAEPAASEAAPVVVITISRVLDVRRPPIDPADLAYRPCVGSTPARTPEGGVPIPV